MIKLCNNCLLLWALCANESYQCHIIINKHATRLDPHKHKTFITLCIMFLCASVVTLTLRREQNVNH